MPPGKVKPGEPPEAAAIRGWSEAVNAREFGRAASFFARDAIVDQGQAIRLPDRSAAAAFSKSLPCKSKVTDVKDEGQHHRRRVRAAARHRSQDAPATATPGCGSRSRATSSPSSAS